MIAGISLTAALLASAFPPGAGAAARGAAFLPPPRVVRDAFGARGMGTSFVVPERPSRVYRGVERYLQASALSLTSREEGCVLAWDDKGRAGAAIFVSPHSAAAQTRVEVVYRSREFKDAQFRQDSLAASLSRALDRRVEEEAEPPAQPGPRAEAEPVRWIPPAYRSDDLAVVVGIGRYRALPALPRAEWDAQNFREHAIRTLGVPPDSVVLLADDYVTNADVVKFTSDWVSARASTSTRVYLFFSGHAALDAEGRLFLAAWNTDPSFLESTGLLASSLIESLTASRAREAVVIFDACFSGAMPPDLLALGGGKRAAFFAAASAFEVARERPEAGHGLFSWHLFRGLRGGAEAKPGALTSGQLADYVKREIAARGEPAQVPVFMGDRDLPLYASGR